MSHRQVPAALKGATLPSRSSALALAVGAALLSGQAAAIEIVGFDWTSDIAGNQGYNRYAATCPEATGNTSTLCGSNGVARPVSSQANNLGTGTGSVIYSWGILGDVDNSRYNWTNNLGYAFRLDSVQLLGANPVGTPPGGNPAVGQNSVSQQQGQGIVAAWELDSKARNGLLVDARVGVTGSGVSANAQLLTTNPYTGLPLPPYDGTAATEIGWFNGAAGTTAQTPIDATVAIGGVGIAKEGAIDLEIFEDFKDVTGGEPRPDSVLGSLRVVLSGERANLEATDVDFGAARVGAGPSIGVSTVSNTGGYRAVGVQTSAPTDSQFTPAGTQSLGLIAAGGGSAQAQYSFAPTVIGEDYRNSISIQSDGQPASFELSGTGVGPQAQATFNGSVYNGDAINNILIDFGNVDIGQSSLPLALILSNVFGADLGDLTDLTVKMVWGDGFALNLLGQPVVEDVNQTPIAADSSATAPFEIVFRPRLDRLYNTELMIYTDVGSALGDTGLTGGSMYRVTLQGRGVPPTPTPLPGMLALFALGLAGMRLTRR